MITVCIDGNYLFHKTFGIFSGFGTKNPGDILSSQAERNMFMRKIITDLCYSLNQIPDLNRVVFCKDSRSWRKDYTITRSIYKESRTQTEGVDWGSFFKLMDEFGEYLEDLGFIFSRVGGAEGDDLLWAWSDCLKDSEDCVILLSGDKDMHQLVDAHGNRWTSIWTSNSKNNRLIVHNDWEMEKDTEPTIFDVTPTSGSTDSKIKKLISSCIVDRIDPKEYIFKKILHGDKKDDVPGVFPHKTKSGKDSNMGEAKSQKIWDLYIQSEWNEHSLEELIEVPEFMEWIAGLSLRLLNQTDNKENRKKFSQYYIENATLVWLNKTTIPEDMVISLRNHVSELAKRKTRNIILDKNLMIEKSPWSDTSTAPKGFDPFDLFI